jgi:CheY-like chemotaxis protein
MAPWFTLLLEGASMNTQGHSRPVILCVDDTESEIQRELFRRVLETAGYTVLIATNAHKALEIFRKNRVDLILTEHIVAMTPGSPTLAATVKRLKPDVPVAIYSADWAPSPQDMKFADMFITKLVSIDELLRTIVRLLDKDPTRAAA